MHAAWQGNGGSGGSTAGKTTYSRRSQRRRVYALTVLPNQQRCVLLKLVHGLQSLGVCAESAPWLEKALCKLMLVMTNGTVRHL